MMVSSTAILFMIVSLALSVLFPVLLAVVLYRKHRYSPQAIAIGALMMVVTQFVIRIPLLSRLGGTPWFKALAASTIAYGLFLGLTAGLFEGVGRLFGFSVLLRDKLDWAHGVAYGIGHGGIESVLLVGLPYVNNIVFSLAINSGTFDSKVAPALPPGSAMYLRNALVNTAPSTFLLGGVERAMTIIVQIALSLLVLYAVKNRKLIFVGYAIFWHAVLDSPLVAVVKLVKSPWIIELWVLAAALLSAGYIRNFIRSETSPDAGDVGVNADGGGVNAGGDNLNTPPERS